jgi:hypothetical protein
MKYNLELNLDQFKLVLQGLTKLPLEFSYDTFNFVKEKYEKIALELNAPACSTESAPKKTNSTTEETASS